MIVGGEKEFEVLVSYLELSTNHFFTQPSFIDYKITMADRNFIFCTLDALRMLKK